MKFGELEEVFSEVSEGVQALLSGISIIIAIIFFIYAVFPLYGEHTNIVLFSILSLFVCFSAPLFFRLPKMSMLPEVIGWLLTGITLAAFGWIIFHATYYIAFSSLGYIVPSGLFGFASSLPLTKGVLMPLYGGERSESYDIEEEEEEEFEEEFDEEFESDFDEGLEESEEEEETFEETGQVETSFDEQEEFEEEDEGPW